MMNARQLYLAWVRTAAPQAYMQALQKIAGRRSSLGGLNSDLMGAMLAPHLATTVGEVNISPSLYNRIMRLGSLGDDGITTTFDSNDSFNPGAVQSLATDTGISIDTGLTTDVSQSDIMNAIGADTNAPIFTPAGANSPGLTASPSAASSSVSSGTLTSATNLFNNFLSAVAGAGTAVAAVFGTQAKNSSAQQLLNVNTARAAQGLPPVNALGQPITASGLAPTSTAMLNLEKAIAGSGGSALPIGLAIGGAILLILLAARRGR